MTASNMLKICVRAAFAIFLTMILVLSACDGKGGEDETAPQVGIPGVSGEICVTSATSYSVAVTGEESREETSEADALLDSYVGNIGGQIRAVEKIDISSADQQVNEILVWGSGASVRYGTTEGAAGTVMLSHPGAVTGLAVTSVDGAPKIVYATERGLGLIGIKDGRPEEESGAYRPMPAGVWSVAANKDGSVIAFTTEDGYLQTISPPALSAGEKCSSVLTSQSVLKVDETNYLPVKTELGGKHAFVLAKQSIAIPTIAPTFSEVYDPIISSLSSGVSNAIVRAVGLETHEIFDVGMSAADGSFHYYDRFIPTDIAFDGASLLVVGLAYRYGSIQSFLAQNCSGSTAEAQAGCLMTAAKNAQLFLFQENGINALTAGVFIYRNLENFSVADHFTTVPLIFQHSDKAPSLLFRIAVEGDRGYIRGTNFLIPLSRSTDSAGKEDWNLGAAADLKNSLMAGIPNDVVPVAGGAVSSFTAVRATDGTGASALEFVNSTGQTPKVLDSGSVYARVDGAGGGRLLAVEMQAGRGGNLFLENLVSRTPITVTDYPNTFIAHAAYDGSVLAFVWSSTGTNETPETEQGWHVAVQNGSNPRTRGESQTFARYEPIIFTGFPSTPSTTDKPWLSRAVSDITFGPAQKIAVLFSGFDSGTWYYRVGLFNYSRDSNDSPYQVKLVGKMAILTVPGPENFAAGKILGIAQGAGAANNFTVYFSAPNGVHGWSITPLAEGTVTTDTADMGGTTLVIPLSPLTDASMNMAGGNRVAIASGDSIVIKDVSNPAAAGATIRIDRREGLTIPSLTGGKVALYSNTLAVAAPYAAKNPFSIYNLTNTAAPSSVCTNCAFLDVKIFSTFSDYLITSSASSGIEIYKLK